MEYDYLIIGAGLFGAVFARQMTDFGKRCLVVERRSHIAGNVYTYKIAGIDVHAYGAHIFHTSNERVWSYINQFTAFNQYTHIVKANYLGKTYDLPFNMNTFIQMWGDITPEDAKKMIASQQINTSNTKPRNLEEQAIDLVGTEIYEKLIRGYTQKQWGRSCADLPASIILRLPVRFTYDNRYFDDKYQGIPIGGYTELVQRLLRGIEVRLDTDYLAERNELRSLAGKIMFTGPIDAYFDYSIGQLNYRSLRFETELLDERDHQGCAVMNYTDLETPFTRVIEHKHFLGGNQTQTVITREYPVEWTIANEPFYPINDGINQELYLRYLAIAQAQKDVLFGGRLGEYRYYNMDEAILSALKAADRENTQ